MEHTYSQLAAAALYHLTSKEMVLSVTGKWESPFNRPYQSANSSLDKDNSDE